MTLLPRGAPIDERVHEVAAILAAGLLRVLQRKSSRNLQDEAKTPLDCGRVCGGDVGAKSEDIAP
jgi:hypothetical protein